MEDNEIKTYLHGNTEYQARLMEKDPVWTTILIYREGKPDKPLTVKTHTISEVKKFKQRNAN